MLLSLKATLEDLAHFFTLWLPTNSGGIPAHAQPCTLLCCHVEEDTKAPPEAPKKSNDLKVKQCGAGLETKVVNCGI